MCFSPGAAVQNKEWRHYNANTSGTSAFVGKEEGTSQGERSKGYQDRCRSGRGLKMGCDQRLATFPWTSQFNLSATTQCRSHLSKVPSRLFYLREELLPSVMWWISLKSLALLEKVSGFHKYRLIPIFYLPNLYYMPKLTHWILAMLYPLYFFIFFPF